MQPTDVQAIDGLARLPLMASLTRVRYHFRLFRAGNFPDTDYKRALTGGETAALHNAWMDDAESWMPKESFDDYQRLIEQANELDR